MLIVGDYTARVGDPSGRSKERRVLTDAEIDSNAQRYFSQALRILDPERTELRFNGEWLAKIDFAELLRLTRIVTVSRLLERDDFERRFKANQPISVSEFLYPLMQGYDSVAIQADVELGGTDQEYNLLTGRDIQQAYGQDPQVALTTPLINGPNGVDKMSASLGNYIGIDDPPAEMFGKAMSARRRADARLLPADASSPTRRRRPIRYAGQARVRPPAGGALARGRGGRGRRGRASTASSSRAGRRRTRRGCRCRPTIPCTCPAFLAGERPGPLASARRAG